MAIQIQLRRGTAAQWTSSNPTLAAGEVGVETDTGKIKAGDGATAWNSLGYVIPSLDVDDLGDVTITSAAAGEALVWNGNAWVNTNLTTTITAAIVDSAPATLDTLNELAAALGDDANFANTIANTIAGKANTSHTHSLVDVTDVTASASELNILDGATLSTTELNYVDGVTSAIQTQLNSKAPSASPSFTGTIDASEATATRLSYQNGIEFYGFSSGDFGTTQTIYGGGSRLSPSTIFMPSDSGTLALTTEVALLTQPIEAKTGAYTLTAAEKGDMVTCSGTFTITVPGNVFAAGDRVDFINIGSGTITFSGSSLTLNAADAKFTINKQWAGATVFFTSATTAVLIGNLA